MRHKETKGAIFAATLITFGSLAGWVEAAVIIGDPGGEGGATEGTSLGILSNTAQIVYGSTLLSAAGLSIGDEITGLSFRVNASENSGPIWTVADYQIRLSTSQNAPGSLDANFVNNRGLDYTVVRSGPLSYNGTEYPTGGSPNSFGPTIEFSNNSFTYSGGDLLLEYTHSLLSSGGSSADANNLLPQAQSQFSSGYNTTTESFSGFGDNYAPIIMLSIAVPEPSSALLVGYGALALAGTRRRKIK